MSDFVRSKYRWVVLGLVMIVNAAIQVLWISYASATSGAAAFFHATELQVGFFSMAFMIAFIPLSMPASWVIDKKGVRFAVGLGSAMAGVFGVLRGLAGADYTLALLATIGIACAQPLLLNSWTAMPAKWFAPGERGTAVGLTTLSNILGIAAGMALSPMLAAGMGFDGMQLAYGTAAAAGSVLFIAFMRERPAVHPGPEGEHERSLMLEGLKGALRNKSFLLVLGIDFIGMGVFNGVSTWIEGIVRPRGFSPDDAGLIGAAMLVGGVIGAVVIPALSDRAGRRKPYLAAALALTVPGLAGLAFMPSFGLLLGSAALMGFFLVSCIPLAMQFAAETTRPAPEGTSAGLVTLVSQTSVVCVYLMEALRAPDGSYTGPLLALVGLLVVAALGALALRERHRPA